MHIFCLLLVLGIIWIATLKSIAKDKQNKAEWIEKTGCHVDKHGHIVNEKGVILYW